MSITRDDRFVTDALGRALAGAECFWLTQPANTSTDPPSPLATIYTDISGGTPETQPVLTDGFGAAHAYLSDAVLYTVAIYHPLFGANPIVLPDQNFKGNASGGSQLTAFQGTPIGTVDGSNKIFQLANGITPLAVLPVQQDVWLNVPLVLGVGYSIALTSGIATITYAVAPQPTSGGVAGDTLWAQGFYLS